MIISNFLIKYLKCFFHILLRIYLYRELLMLIFLDLIIQCLGVTSTISDF